MRANWFVPGIRFNDFLFTEPVRLADWTASPRFAGLFVILASDPNWAPRAFRPLCFGEFGNNSRQPMIRDYGWLMNAMLLNATIAANGAVAPNPAIARTLYVSLLLMPFSTTAQRLGARDELVGAYNPDCQANSAKTAGELAQRVDEMAREHQEQTAHVLLLLSNMNRFFEPQPVPQRRPIGFLAGPLDQPAAGA